LIEDSSLFGDIEVLLWWRWKIVDDWLRMTMEFCPEGIIVAAHPGGE
jgi:hypothetical protein